MVEISMSGSGEIVWEYVSPFLVVLAAMALFRFNVGVLPLIGGCALAGLAVTLLRRPI